MTKNDQGKDFNLQIHREKLVYHLMQSIDGAVFQGNRAIDAYNANANINNPNNDYMFNQERFELSLYLQCLSTVFLMVESLRCNIKESELRFDNLQSIKTNLEQNINHKLLFNIRNEWIHMEKTLLGKLRNGNVPKDVVNSGVSIGFWMQVVNGEILLSNKQCATHDEHWNIVWLTKDYISVQKTVDLLCEIKEEINKIVANSSFIKYSPI